MGEKKTLTEHGYIRAKDCYYASHVGYEWYPIKQTREDFDGHPFDHVMCTSGYLTHVIEPDTRVPNFSTDPREVITLMIKLKRAGKNLDPHKYAKMMLADIDRVLTEDK